MKDEATELEAAAERIAALRNDPRTAAVVRRAVVRPGALTLRRYLALEDAGSPVLSGVWPWEDSEAMSQAFCTSFAILFPERKIPLAEDLAAAIAEMADEVVRGFSTVMQMKFPKPTQAAPPQAHDGLGWVARIWGRLVAAGVRDPLDMPLDQVFILSAAMSANEGAETVGEDYRERTLPECGMRNGECEMEEGSR